MNPVFPWVFTSILQHRPKNELYNINHSHSWLNFDGDPDQSNPNRRCSFPIGWLINRLKQLPFFATSNDDFIVFSQSRAQAYFCRKDIVVGIVHICIYNFYVYIYIYIYIQFIYIYTEYIYIYIYNWYIYIYV